MLRTAALMTVAGVFFVPAAYAGPGRGPEARLEQVQALAHDVAMQAQQLRAETQASRHRFTPREQRALRQMDALVFRARRFHRESERPRVSPADLDREYHALDVAFRNVADSFGRLRVGNRARQDFHRLSITMDRLDDRYERLVQARYGRPGRWDRTPPHVGRR